MRRTILMAGTTALLTAGCATSKVVPKPGQVTLFSDGRAAVVCKAKQSHVVILPIGEDDRGRLGFTVMVKNLSRFPFNFGTENICATTPSGKGVKVYSREKLESEARTRAALMALAVGMNAAALSYQAAQPSQTYYSGAYAGSANYNVFGRNNAFVGNISGTQSGQFSGMATTYNPAASATANAQIQSNMIGQLGLVEQAKRGNLAQVSNVLATTTVNPGAIHSGVVVTDSKKEISISVSVSGENHSAHFELTKVH